MSFFEPKKRPMRYQWFNYDWYKKCKTKRKKKLSSYNTNQRNCKWTRKEFPKTEDRLGTCKIQENVYLSNHVDLNPLKQQEERRNKFYHQHITFSKNSRRQKSARVANAEEISTHNRPRRGKLQRIAWGNPRETSSLEPAKPSGPGASRQEARKRL